MSQPNQQVWKFAISLSGTTVIPMPLNAGVCHVGAQGESVCLWALVNPEEARAFRRFFIAGTGHPIPVGSIYHGTAHVPPFVWHVFEE